MITNVWPPLWSKTAWHKTRTCWLVEGQTENGEHSVWIPRAVKSRESLVRTLDGDLLRVIDPWPEGVDLPAWEGP